MLYRLALKLGKANVDALARSLTAKQWMEWEAYAALEPFDETRDDYRAASIVAMIFNMAVAVKDRKPLGDFILTFGEQPEKRHQTPEEQERIARWITMAWSVDAKDM